MDSGKTYRATVSSLQAALPARYDCISGRNLGESERAMLQYFGGIVTVAEQNPSSAYCTLLLVQARSVAEQSAERNARLIWEGGRAGNESERFLLYLRRP
jgi:hypothetical protein